MTEKRWTLRGRVSGAPGPLSHLVVEVESGSPLREHERIDVVPAPTTDLHVGGGRRVEHGLREQVRERLTGLHNGTAPNFSARYQDGWRAGIADAQDAVLTLINALPESPLDPEGEQARTRAPVLSSEEATALVAAYLSEDHDARSADAAIKRLGDWLDGVYDASTEIKRPFEDEGFAPDTEMPPMRRPAQQSQPILSKEQRERLRRIADIIGGVHRPCADPELHEDDARLLRELAGEGER